ncbi:IclR family transcriptional regulator C-terminal domain-containing protein, partial [Priestia megaterium]|uniref:IclR family transcriptional regulator domain-containing protein n=1 Tax=Priestia megaterium TaxID=1404 RepID=UPI002FFE6F9D
KEQLIKDLPVIKEGNFAISMDERGAGINAISSVIYDKNKNVTFCLCVSGPSIRFNLDKMESFKDRIKDYAKQISEKAVQ